MWYAIRRKALCATVPERAAVSNGGELCVGYLFGSMLRVGGTQGRMVDLPAEVSISAMTETAKAAGLRRPPCFGAYEGKAVVRCVPGAKGGTVRCDISSILRAVPMSNRTRRCENLAARIIICRQPGHAVGPARNCVSRSAVSSTLNVDLPATAGMCADAVVQKVPAPRICRGVGGESPGSWEGDSQAPQNIGAGSSTGICRAGDDRKRIASAPATVWRILLWTALELAVWAHPRVDTLE